MTRFERICIPGCTSDAPVANTRATTVEGQGPAWRQGLNWLGLVALVWGLPAACASAACPVSVTAQQSLPAYEICPLPQLPAVFAEPELAALFAGLDPGQSLDVTPAFLRVATPWPYLDIRGPGANSSGGMPNEPRAVFLLRANHPAVSGPLLIVAPAQLQHQLRAAADGGLPRDSWHIAQGPFAPTFYGRVQRSQALVDFVAFPRADPAASGPVSADQRATYLNQIVDFFVSE